MKPTKALILFLAPLALAACSSDPEWADLEAHEKTVELQERYAPLLVGTWHVERIGEKQRYFEKLTFSDSRNDIVGSRGTFTGLRKWQTRQLVTINGEERYTDWQDVEGENGTFTGTWQLVWERNSSVFRPASMTKQHYHNSTIMPIRYTPHSMVSPIQPFVLAADSSTTAKTTTPSSLAATQSRVSDIALYTMKQAKLLFLLIAALAFASCRPTARQAVADVVQPTDSTEAVTSADTLRLVITDKSLSQTDSLIRRILKLPLDSIVVEMVNNTDSTCMTGEAYTIEQRINKEWKALPIKPRKDGAVYAFNDIGYELAPHSSRQFSIHVEPDKYDFERGKEFRIAKDFLKSGQSNPQSVYCYFSFE